MSAEVSINAIVENPSSLYCMIRSGAQKYEMTRNANKHYF